MEAVIDAGAAAPAADIAGAQTGGAAVENTPAAAPNLPISPAKQIDDADLLAIWDKNHPLRENGKFVARTPAVAAPATNETPAATAETPAVTTDSAAKPEDGRPETTQAAPSIEPPHSWSAEQKAKWATVSPDLREYIAKREADAHEAITRTGAQVKAYAEQVKAQEPLNQLFQQHKEDFDRRGVSPAQGVAQLLAAQRLLDQNPLNGIVQIAASFGLKPQDLVSYLSGQGQQQPDPVVAQLRAEIVQLKGDVNAQKTYKAAQEKEAQDAALSSVEKVIADFSKDKPFWKDVEDDVAHLMPGLRAKYSTLSHEALLKKAYDAATAANPDIFERIQADQRAKDEAARAADLKAKAVAASKAATVNVKSGTASPSPKTMDATLTEIAHRAYGRAS